MRNDKDVYGRPLCVRCQWAIGVSDTVVAASADDRRMVHLTCPAASAPAEVPSYSNDPD